MFRKIEPQLLSPNEIKESVRAQFDFSRQEIRDIPNGHNRDGAPNRCAFIWFACIKCGQGRMIARHTAIRKYSPYCRRCTYLHKSPPSCTITPDMIPESVRFSFDFNRQEYRVVGQHGVRQWHILHICPRCKREIFVVRGVAMSRLTPYCHTCCNKFTRWGKPKGNGYFINEDGYRMIDAERFYPEHKEYLREFLATPSNGHSYWFAEHRIVALLTFGPWAIADGMVIRHLDGNKLNNEPSNLLPGSDADNKLDHFAALQLMRQWRFIAMTLAHLLSHRP